MATKLKVAHAQAAVAHKVRNNNVAISIDKLGQERLLMGRGLGLQLQPTDTVDSAIASPTSTSTSFRSVKSSPTAFSFSTGTRKKSFDWYTRLSRRTSRASLASVETIV
ncbi:MULTISPECIES: CAT RNA binding domain-containing protein [unclassified Cryobacterium]|uniref:CAT RNA binding domain-containing protein n=1 Tax=unclassified Cryobacterium TaxID=2649013 RepID=UPI001E441EFE|nr:MULTISPECIES: CAT RNA binding domain-containing protein [unclassified Cryobacterium]